MYKVLKNGFTTCGKVWMAGDIIDDTTALTGGLFDWYKQTDGLKKGVRFIEKISATPTKVTIEKVMPQESVVEKTMVKDLPDFADAVLVKGYTLDEALGWDWATKSKKLGINLAKKVNDYGKSGNNK
jgi:hypothetical protein